jgi:hypothetical protein
LPEFGSDELMDMIDVPWRYTGVEPDGSIRRQCATIRNEHTDNRGEILVQNGSVLDALAAKPPCISRPDYGGLDGETWQIV